MTITDYDDSEIANAMLREVPDNAPTRAELAADEEADRAIVLERMYQDWCKEHRLDPDELDTILYYEEWFTEQQQEDEG